MQVDMSHWPRTLVELVDTVGLEAAMRIVDVAAGQHRYIPKTPRAGHPWVDMLGADAFGQLCSRMGGTHLEVPRGAFRVLKKIVVLELLGQGLSSRKIAQRARCTERYVWHVKRQSAPGAG